MPAAPHEDRPLAPRMRTADDVVVVGGGLAGLFCALKLSPLPVTVLTAAPIGAGASTAWAQGGVAAAVAEGDFPQAHARDTVAAGAGLVEEALALSVAREAPARVRDLLELGVPFDRDLDGRLTVSREAAHSARRIVHVKGDMAGRAIMDALVAAVRRTPSIRLLEGFVADRLTLAEGRTAGLRARGPDGRVLDLESRALVLATGGIGGLYAVTTNPPEASGIGLSVAARAGALIADPEFVQFHPTAIAVGRDPAPLATEALRGDGAVLVNSRGERFMQALDPLGELAPRDVVARGVFAEIAAGRGAFLDARAAIGDRFAEHYPTVHASCLRAGIDPARQPIPVAPAAHYHMGGVATDAHGRTSLPGLWAAGEAACTGLHGANRLASNSLLEAVVFAARAAEDILGRDAVAAPRRTAEPDLPRRHTVPADAALLREQMSGRVGVIRRGPDLASAMRSMAALERAEGPAGHRATAALLVTAAAWARRESRGGHFRTDHPRPDPAQARRTFLTLAQARECAAQVGQPEFA